VQGKLDNIEKVNTMKFPRIDVSRVSRAMRVAIVAGVLVAIGAILFIRGWHITGIIVILMAAALLSVFYFLVVRPARLPADAVLTNGAGNFATWGHRFHRYRRFGTQLATISGSMGYGVPAAVAAKLRHPDRVVLCLAGDGDFLMTGQELATAVQFGAPIVVVILNNGMYGTIRMHQEREHPGRIIATELKNPDFAALAKAYGAHGETVTRTAEFAAAFERALGSGKPALIDVLLDPEVITPRQTLTEIREAALAKSR